MVSALLPRVCALIRSCSGTGSDLDSPLLPPAASFFLSCQTRPGVGVAPALGPGSSVCLATRCLISLVVDLQSHFLPPQ